MYEAIAPVGFSFERLPDNSLVDIGTRNDPYPGLIVPVGMDVLEQYARRRFSVLLYGSLGNAYNWVPWVGRE